MSEASPLPPPPGRPPGMAAPKLSLPRRRALTRSPFAVSEKSAVTREQLDAFRSATQIPVSSAAAGAARTQAAELERSLRQWELMLAERERVVAETEGRLADQERDVAEAEALLEAREKLIAATRRAAPVQVAISPEEKVALEQLRAELERQEGGLKEAKQGLREREQFIDESEAKLFEKVQAQQEKEIELEQREEDLRARERRFREREAAADPLAAATLKAEDAAAKKFDEFNE